MAAGLLAWGEQNGRRFAWREWREPYRVLVVEILLRQTRAESVAVFIPAFLEKYPDARSLGSAPEAELLEELRCLGFGSQRAAQLKALGAALADAGAVPVDVDGLLVLPGVGRYTAGMVSAVAGGTAAPAVDTNVARVVCRVFGLTPSHAEPRKSTNVWQLAGEMVEASPDAARLTWAVLDLAADICTARKPQCQSCPLASDCHYARSLVSGHHRQSETAKA